MLIKALPGYSSAECCVVSRTILQHVLVERSCSSNMDITATQRAEGTHNVLSNMDITATQRAEGTHNVLSS